MELDKTPLNGTVRDLAQVELIRVTGTDQGREWAAMISEYHYLGIRKMIGPRILYYVTISGRIIGAISFSGGSSTLEARDDYIGWDLTQKREQLKYVVNNNRFLLLPWIHVRNLASHVLAKSLKRVRIDWKEQYGAEPQVVETFVDSERYQGTCYRAANWVEVGETKGFGRQGKKIVYHGQKKRIFLRILNKGFLKQIKPRQLSLIKNRGKRLHMVLSRALGLIGASNIKKILQTLGITTKNKDQLLENMYKFLRLFIDLFKRVTHIDLFVIYVISRMAYDVERKSIEPIALKFGIPPRTMQYFMSNQPLDDEGLRLVYQKEIAQLSDPDAMLTFDDTCMGKKGNESVGVAYQYCGNLGKTANCQSGMFMGIAGMNGYGLYDFSLYMPIKWFEPEYAEKRKKCGVPENLIYKSKNDLALEILRKATEAGEIQGKWIGADCAFGSDETFLDGIPKQYYYFADVRKTTQVFTEIPKVSTKTYKYKGKICIRQELSIASVTVDSLAQSDKYPWVSVYLGEGTKGPVISEEKVISVYESRQQGTNFLKTESWLYIRKIEGNKVKFSICNAPADTTKEKLRELARRRWSIEQCFEECKDGLGMDHYELRSWTGWYRHMLFTLITHMVLTKMRLLYTTDEIPPRKGAGPPCTTEEYRERITSDEQPLPIVISPFLSLYAIRNFVYAAKLGLDSFVEIYKSCVYQINSAGAAYLSCCKMKEKAIIQGVYNQNG